MNDKSLLMKNEIRTLSGYRALTISKYYLIALLSLATLYLCVLRLAASSFYILLSSVTLPPILQFIIRDSAKKSNRKFINELLVEKPFCLSMLKSKYGYTRLKYFSNSAAYLITLLLISLWQLNYTLTGNLSPLLSKLPFFVLITSLFLQFLAVIFYQIKLPYDLIHNKV